MSKPEKKERKEGKEYKDASKFKNVSIGICYLTMAILLVFIIVIIPLLYGDINNFLSEIGKGGIELPTGGVP